MTADIVSLAARRQLAFPELLQEAWGAQDLAPFTTGIGNRHDL